MSKPAFTPGPWYFINNSWWGESSVYGPDDCLIAEVTIRDSWTEENQTDLELIKEANARLIAAAPDMYEALQATLLFHSASPWDCEKQNRWRELTGKDEATTRALCDLVRSALAKAEGRSA